MKNTNKRLVHRIKKFKKGAILKIVGEVRKHLKEKEVEDHLDLEAKGQVDLQAVEVALEEKD